MVTIGEGATAQVQADIQKLGTNLLQVFRGQGFGGGGGARSSAPPFTMDDVDAIENEISGVRAVAPSSQHARRRRSTATRTGRRRSPAPATSSWKCATGRWPRAATSPSPSCVPAPPCACSATRSSRSCSATRIRSARSMRLGKLSCQVIGAAVGRRGSRASARTRTTSSSCRCARCSGAWPATPTSTRSWCRRATASRPRKCRPTSKRCCASGARSAPAPTTTSTCAT